MLRLILRSVMRAKKRSTLVEPGSWLGRVDMPARALEQPVADPSRLVGGVIVHDKMNIEIGGDSGLDLIVELAEFLAQ